MDGWIKLHRKIRQSPIFNNLELFRLWTICLTEATHKKHSQVVGKQVVELEPGQFVTGRFDLHSMYNNGLKRDQQKSPKTVWRWLEALEKGDFLTIKTTNKFSIVTVKNWSFYQGNDQENDQQMTNKRPTNDQQVTTNKNGKNVKKESGVSTDVDLQISDLRQRYSQEQLQHIDEYMDMIRHTRRSATISKNVVLGIYKNFDKYPTICVEYAVRTHTGNPAYHSKNESYTFGILRNTTAEEAHKKLYSKIVPMRQNGKRPNPKDESPIDFVPLPPKSDKLYMFE